MDELHRRALKQGMRHPFAFDAAEVAPAAVPRMDCHLHTNWTDGSQSVGQVYDEAVKSGLDAILFSEHARRTSIDWFPEFAAEVRALPKRPCRAFVGVECKVISFDGNLDTCPEITSLCDVVMASVHRFTDEKGSSIPFEHLDTSRAVELEFRLAQAAARNPLTDILGHAFGMCIRRYNVVPPDDKVRALIACAAENDVVVEINSHYHPDPWQLLKWCRELGAKVALGSNAHRAEEVGQIVRVLENGTSL